MLDRETAVRESPAILRQHAIAVDRSADLLAAMAEAQGAPTADGRPEGRGGGADCSGSAESSGGCGGGGSGGCGGGGAGGLAAAANGGAHEAAKKAA